MNDRDEFAPIRRILVPLDSSPESMAVLEPAAWVASAMRSKLTAVFVEEQELFALAKLPFSREISIIHSSARNLDPSRLAQEMRARAVLTEKTIKKLAKRHQIEWSFKVVRGNREAEVAAQARARDLVAMFSDQNVVGPGGGIGMAASLHSSLVGSGWLMVNRNMSFKSGPVLALFDGTAASVQALQLAAGIAHRDAVPLHVLILGDDAQLQERLQRRVHEVLDGESLASLNIETGVDAENALKSLCLREHGLLVLVGKTDGLETAQGDLLKQKIRCPVIVLNAPDPDTPEPDTPKTDRAG